MNLGDWPLNKKGGALIPTFSWCGSEDTWDIVWPNWDLAKSVIMGMDRYGVRDKGKGRWGRGCGLSNWDLAKSVIVGIDRHGIRDMGYLCRYRGSGPVHHHGYWGEG